MAGAMHTTLSLVSLWLLQGGEILLQISWNARTVAVLSDDICVNDLRAAYSEPDRVLLTEVKDAKSGQGNNRFMAEAEPYKTLQAPGIKSVSHLFPRMETA